MDPFDQPQRVPTRRPLILIVDDEPGVTESLKEILGLDGYAVDTAANGLIALDRLQQRAYDLIVCDVYMPQLTGVEFYRALAHQYPHLLTRIMFLTGDASRGDIRAFFAQTRAPLLTKPFSLEAFGHMVQSLLEVHAPQSPARPLANRHVAPQAIAHASPRLS
jgi:two-component system, NtrC family, sensor kinase